MTRVFGEAWEALTSKKYWGLRRSAFEKRGCLVTLSGKNDHLIRCENHGAVWPPGPQIPFQDEDYAKVALSSHPDFEYIGAEASDEASEGDVSDFAADINLEDAELPEEAASDTESDVVESDDKQADLEQAAGDLQAVFDELFPEEAAIRKHGTLFLERQ